VCGSHHGLAATAAHSREAGYIYATGIVIYDVAYPCTDEADHTFLPGARGARPHPASGRPAASSAWRSPPQAPSDASLRRLPCRRIWLYSCKMSPRKSRACGRGPLLSRQPPALAKRPIICSSVNLCFFIRSSSNQFWRKFSVAGHDRWPFREDARTITFKAEATDATKDQVNKSEDPVATIRKVFSEPENGRMTGLSVGQSRVNSTSFALPLPLVVTNSSARLTLGRKCTWSVKEHEWDRPLSLSSKA
jgi:hypothetical protein